jgi:molybdopterin molybdotransferase
MDGFAVRAADTFGASSSLPAYLTCVQSIPMGKPPEVAIQAGQTAEIHTGGMLPKGADAVVMLERTQRLSEDEIEVLAPVAPGENLVKVGEDVRKGQSLLPVGHRIRPQDLGGLLGVGILEVEVVVPPRVGILSCGDELVSPQSRPAPGQVRDINSYTLDALFCEAGGGVQLFGVAGDDWEDFFQRARSALDESDMLVMTAGSSVSSRDLTRRVIGRLGSPGVLQHGLAVKPGKPTIIAVCDEKPVIGLPGNPVSALLVARQLVVPIVKRFLGELPPSAPPMVEAVLGANISSSSGREDLVPVQLVEGEEELIAEPVFGKSNLIYTLVRAQGLIRVPLDKTGIKAGTVVAVSLF